MTDVTEYEGEYESADGVAFEARYQAETGLFVLSQRDNPTDLRTVDGTVFVELVHDGVITPLEGSA
jgi:hypothetical protein